MNSSELTVKLFITPVYPYGNDHYYHEMIAVAEGFRELGCRVIGNADYWWEPERQAYLIPGDVHNTDFQIAIYDYRYVTSFAHLLFRKGYPNFDRSKLHVLIDRNDWLQPIWWKNDHYSVFDRIFAGNIYRHVSYAANIRPWAIGLTQRIMDAIDAHYQEGGAREPVTGYNFRGEHNMRGYLLGELRNSLKTYPAAARFTEPRFGSDTDAFYYAATTNRHNPAYFRTLCATRLFMAFGGYYEFLPLRYLPYTVTDRLLRKLTYLRYKRLKAQGKDFSHLVFIFQQDNFRFWEVLYSGAVALNLDLDHWNFMLPVMPEAGRHYLGIEKLREHGMEHTLAQMPAPQLEEMGRQGRAWVRAHYSPRAQAQRILSSFS